MVGSVNLVSSMLKWHPILSGMLAMAIANCAVTSLPSPDAQSGKFYRWFFNFFHSAVGAIARVVSQYKNGNEAPK